MDNNNISVYHRASILASIFPWLVFGALLPISSGGMTASTDVVDGPRRLLPHHQPSRRPRRGGEMGRAPRDRDEFDDDDGSRRRRADNRLRRRRRRRDDRRIGNSNSDSNRRRTQDMVGAKVQRYCGKTWGEANSSCMRPCPAGVSEGICEIGELCYSDLTSCPSMDAPPPQPPGGAAGLGEAVPGGYYDGGAFPSVGNSHVNDGYDDGVVQPTTMTSTSDVDVASSISSSVVLPFQVGAIIPPECPPSTTNIVNIGYYQSWAKYRNSNCNPQNPMDIPVVDFGYTHLIYGFADISPDTGEIRPYGGVMDEIGLYEEFNALRGEYGGGGLVTMIAVGGWNMDQGLFVKASSTPESRRIFADSVVTFLSTHGFDGIDLDWEYPVTRQGTSDDYVNYPLLVKALRDALNAETKISGRVRPLTMAIPVNPDKLDTGYDMIELAKYVDWFHLMSYDIHGSWDDVSGSNTDMSYIIDTIEDNILAKGVGGEKLVFGMASYGRSMQLKDPENCDTIDCPIDGPGMMGCSGEDGFSPYFELRETYVDSGNYQSLLLNEKTGSMEMVLDGGIFVSLDLEDTFSLKRDYYLSKCFRGQMWWATDMIKDPPFGPAQASATNESQAPPEQIGASTATTNTSPGAAPGVTQDDAYCADANDAELVPIEDCLGFVFCQNKRMSGSTTLCSPGLIFDANMGICNWPSDTNLCGFEFCPNKMSGYVSFEECSKFYYCKAGKIDGDIDICPDGTLFDVVMGICNWASMVVCDTKAPTSPPIVAPPPVPLLSQPPVVVTPRPTYGKVGSASSTIVNVSSPGSSPEFEAKDSSPYQAARLRFTPTDDAYVKESEPYANYNDHYVVVDQNARYDGLLRFYVHGLENRKVEYVKLRLYVSNQSTMGGNIYRCRDDWHEDMVTWDSVPSIIGDQPIALVQAALLDEWIEVDVSGLVQKDGPVSFRITSDSSDNVMYSSKENANGNSPELIVGVEPADPSSATFGDSNDSLPTTKHTFKIGTSDDAFVFRTTGDKNYGQDTDLKVDMDDGYKKSYLRFDLSNVRIDAVITAKLRLYATLSSASGGMFITVTDSAWNEGSLTYSNAPPADGIPLGMLDSVEAGKWYELDVTDAITESGPLTICILGNHKDKVMYSSKDGPHSPEIALTLEEFVPLTTRGGRVVDLIPTDDATITLQNPNLNLGTSKNLKTDTTGGMRDFLLRFDATDVPRGQVKSAILRLYSMNMEPAFGGTFIENRRSHWEEQTVTWNNAPDSDGRVMGSLMEVEYGSWYNMDVTSAVIGGSAVSIRVSSPHTNAAIYGSKESDHKPQLIIQYSPPDPVPEDFDLYIPTDDTSILMEKPDQNFGRIEQLKVDGHMGVYNSLLRFNLSSVEKGTVEHAILRLYAVDGSPSGGTFVSTRVSDWTQHQVTWRTAPAADGKILGTLGEVVPYQWYEIDLANIAKDLGGESLSIRIAPSHGLRCAYSSSRDRLGHLPQLLLKTDLYAGMGE